MPNDKLNIILGGVTIEALLNDGSKAEVKVRQLCVRDLVGKWLPNIGNEGALAELYCGQEEGWDDKLLPESHDEIIRIGGELNRPRFARWAESRRAEISEVQSVEPIKPLPAPASSSASPTSSSPAAVS